jgi:A nuclease of the HNH/ENDO VII superfamily with conserved WHH/SMI1 / KNR4 family (SUKH-1)
MTGPNPPGIAGARFAFQVVNPGSPMLRIRYRAGIAVDPYGFPDWIPYARVLVDLPAVPPGLGPDEVRVLDGLTANETAARTGDPLWTYEDRATTPAGWTWARLGTLARPGTAPVRRIALVPVELHGAYRHLGGVSTDRISGPRGLTDVQGGPPQLQRAGVLTDDALAKVEQHLGYPLPAGYRRFVARSNGGRPARPSVHPRFGFVVDQPFFGVARADRLQDLLYANAWFGDRLTRDWLAAAYVQGGLIAVKVRGDDRGSIWYWDDDDPRELDQLYPEEICAGLLHRVADDFTAFWLALNDFPLALRALAAAYAGDGLTQNGLAGDKHLGRARIAADERTGTSLPSAARLR